MLGAMIFSIGAWIRFEYNFERWILQLGAEHYWYGCYVLLAAGVITMLMAFLGCAGALFERPGFLTSVS